MKPHFWPCWKPTANGYGSGRWLWLAPLVLSGACSTAPSSSSSSSPAAAAPTSVHNVCSLFAERKEWFLAARQAEQDWQVPIPVTMAFIYQESLFIANNRPQRLANGERPSSAYGYSQALDGTWALYQKQTGRAQARRDNFQDSADFIGWYNRNSSQQAGIAPTDAYHLYLAYHEGAKGYQQGSWRSKPWLQQIATKVDQRARDYQRQLVSCRDETDDQWFWKGLVR